MSTTSTESVTGDPSAGNTAITSTVNQQPISMSSTTSDAAATTVASGPSESTPTKAVSSNTTPLAPLKMPHPSNDEEDTPDGSYFPRYETPPPLFKDPNGYFSEEELEEKILFPETPSPMKKVGPPPLVRYNSVFASIPGGVTPVILFPLARSSSASDDDDLPLESNPFSGE